jgi:RHS repeat-associated protein
MKKTNNHNTEYTTRSSIMRFRNLFAGFILFSMLALLTPSAFCAVTRMLEEYPKLYNSQTNKSFGAAMQIKDGDEVFYDYKGTIWAPNGFRGITKKYTYSTSQEDWVLDSEEEFTITTPGVHKTPMGATVVVPGFIGMNNPFYLGVEMGTRTVGVDLRATIPNVNVGQNAQLNLTLDKDGTLYHRRFDIDLGAGENTVLFEFDGAFYEDEDGEGGDPVYPASCDEILAYTDGVDATNEVTALDCGNGADITESTQTSEGEPQCPTCGTSSGSGSTGGGGGGCGQIGLLSRCAPSDGVSLMSGGGNPQSLTVGGSYGSVDRYGPYIVPIEFSRTDRHYKSDQPRVFGSAGSAAENWALDAYQMVQRRQKSIGSDTMEIWYMFKGDKIIDVAKTLEDNHYNFRMNGYTAEFVDSTTLLVNLPGGRKMAFNNLSSDWMRLAYANLPNGDTVEYVYDGSDRLQYMTYPDNTTIEFQYVSGIIDKILKRNGDYLKFNLGTTVETIEMYDSTDALLTKSGWEYDSDSKQIKAQYDYTGSNLSTQVVMGTYTFTTVAGTSVVATASSEGILTTYDTWDSQPAGSYRLTISNGIEEITQEKVLIYTTGGFSIVNRVIAANNQVIGEETGTHNSQGALTHVESKQGIRYFSYQYDMDSNVSASIWWNIVSVTDELGCVTSYEYPGTDIIAGTSSLPLSVSICDGEGKFLTRYAYIFDASGNLLNSGAKDSNGKWSTYVERYYEWDANHDSYMLTKRIDALGRAHNNVYNSTGQITHEGIGAATHTNTYNEKGRISERISPEGKQQYISFYDSGHPSSHTIDNATIQFGYGYMQYGFLTDVTDARGQWTEFVYDNWNRLIKTNIYGEDSTVDASCTVEYDAWGRQSSYTDYIGQEKRPIYDSLGRLIREEYVNSSDVVTASIVYNFNNDSQLSSIQSHCGEGCQEVIYYGYDSIGRPLYRSGVGYGNIGWSYDAAGRVDSLQWMKESGRQVLIKYAYDETMGIGSIYTDSGLLPLVCYAYDITRAVDAVLYENSTYAEYSYDSTYGHVTSIKNRNASDVVIAGFDYTYDLDGLVTNVTLEDDSYIAYSHDAHGRLADEHKKNSSNNTIYRHQYQYDAVGNRTQHIHTDSVSNSTTFTLTYNDLNQLTQREWTISYQDYDEVYTYDLNGNLTQKQEREDDGDMVVMTQWDYTWDHEDRLIEVVKQTGDAEQLQNSKKVQYRYCPSCGGNRTHKIVYNWSGGEEEGGGECECECSCEQGCGEECPCEGECDPECGGGGEGAWELAKWLRYETIGLNQLRVDEKYDSDQDGLDEPDPFRTERATYNGTGDIKQIIREILYTYSTAHTASNPTKTDIYYHYDRMGVVQALTGSNGALITGQRFESDAFGSFDGESTYTTRRLTGKEYDQDIGCYFFHARWYDVSCGRFLSFDPIARTPMPAAFDAYSMADNNPISQYDPTGLVVVINEEGKRRYCANLWRRIIAAKGKYKEFLWDIYRIACRDSLTTPDSEEARKQLGKLCEYIQEALDAIDDLPKDPVNKAILKGLKQLAKACDGGMNCLVDHLEPWFCHNLATACTIGCNGDPDCNAICIKLDAVCKKVAANRPY